MDEDCAADAEAARQLDGALPAPLCPVQGLDDEGRPQRLLAQRLPRAGELVERPRAGLLPSARLGPGQVHALHQGLRLHGAEPSQAEALGWHIHGGHVPRGCSLGRGGGLLSPPVAEAVDPADALYHHHPSGGQPPQAPGRVADAGVQYTAQAERNGRRPRLRGKLAHEGALQPLDLAGCGDDAERCVMRAASAPATLAVAGTQADRRLVHACCSAERAHAYHHALHAAVLPLPCSAVLGRGLVPLLIHCPTSSERQTPSVSIVQRAGW
mmetsp:Transcript_125573/g.390937  ORF Transcript_125573/g.390937 Transcript_125573/m.390937 type:complete len:269 (-) Transcript_125573:294-1100(-)